jgi:hypothetical protein
VLPLDDIKANLNSKTIYLLDGGKSLSKINSRCRRTPSELQNLAIIVPYRNRTYNLKVFLQNMHAFWTRQKVNYGIYLIEPTGNTTFNRGLLINIGFLEAQKDAARPLNYSDLAGHTISSLGEIKKSQIKLPWTCFVFHDVDM